MLPFLSIPLPRIAKNDEPDNVEKAHKSLKSPKTIKKLESFAHHVPENFQNITPNMSAINTPLLYRKDNLDGHSSNDIFFMKKFFFKGKNWVINKKL